MPWREMTPMHQRTLFIADHLRGTRSVTELCAEYGIARKTDLPPEVDPVRVLVRRS